MRGIVSHMIDADELRRRWAVTLGNDSPSGWPEVEPGATVRPADDAAAAATLITATLSGMGTLAGTDTLSGMGTLAGATPPATLSGATTPAADSPTAVPPVIAVEPLGNYTLGQELGRGGMGVVYRARQRSLQREVAIKLVRQELASAGTQETFIAEALVNGHLDHPNIVPVHELGRDAQGQVFLAMKLVGGTSWKDLLHPKTDAHRAAAAGWTTGRHLAVLEAVGNAVAFAHSKGIVHRDLKPENVMVGEFGEVLVMDWGIAVDIRDEPGADLRTRHRSSVTAPAGTPSYMAPEQAEGRGKELGPWTDTYLLGAILCEILTGSAPHRGRTLLEVLLAASTSHAPQFPAEVPAGLVAICTKALARDPAARYRTVAELQDALREQARNRASDEVAASARTALERAADRSADGDATNIHQRYAAYAEAIAGFRQALAMWPANPTAAPDERRARLAYAAAARSAGDLGLAEVQLDGLNDGADLAAERALQSAERLAQTARVRAAKRNRVLLVASVIAIVGGSLTATLLVEAERSRTAVQRDKAVTAEQEARAQEAEAVRQRAAAVAATAVAEQAKGVAEQAKSAAEQAKSDAVTQRDTANREAWNSRILVAGNLARDQQPNAQAEAALALLLVQRIHPELAPPGGASSTGLANQLWERYALAARPPTPRWQMTFNSPVRGVRMLTGGVLVAPSSGAVEVRDDDGKQRCVLSRLDGADLPPDLAWTETQGSARSFAIGGNRAVHLAGEPGEDAVIRIWDLADGTKLRSWKRPGTSAVALSDDGLHVIAAGSEEGVVLDVETGREVLTFFWRSAGKWPDARRSTFSGLAVSGRLGTDAADEPQWSGRLEAVITGQPTDATGHPEAPAERRLVAAHLPDAAKAKGAPAPPTAVSEIPPVLINDPHWGLIATAKPLPVRLGPAAAAGSWSGTSRAGITEVVVARGATVTRWSLADQEQRQALHHGSDTLVYDEEPASGGQVAWLADGTCILALESSLIGEGYLLALDPRTGDSAWQRKLENAVSTLAASADGNWLAVASAPQLRTKGDRLPAHPAAPPWLLRRQGDGKEWPLDQFLAEAPVSVQFTADHALTATTSDGTQWRIDLSGTEPANAEKVATPAAVATQATAWVTSFGGSSRDGVLTQTSVGVALAADGRLLHPVAELAHGWFAPDGRTLHALAWDGKTTTVRRIPLVSGDLPGQLPPLRSATTDWQKWMAAEPAQAADDGSTTLRPVEAGFLP